MGKIETVCEISRDALASGLWWFVFSRCKPWASALRLMNHPVKRPKPSYSSPVVVRPMATSNS
jgi:hypothetical protein